MWNDNDDKDTTLMTEQPTKKPSAADILSGTSKDSAPPALKKGPKHRAAGEYAGGRVLAFDSIEEREIGRTLPDGTYEPGDVKRYPSGDVIWGLYVDVQTIERDPMREHDDGVRRIYLSGAGKKAQHVSSLKAVQEAIAAAGKPYMEVGGDLQIAWTHQVPTQASPATSWAARYAPPAAVALATAEPQPYAAPAPQPQYAPAAPVPAGYGQPAPQPQYGQPQYGQPQYGQPQAAAPAQHMTPEQVAALGQLGAAPVQSAGQAPF